MHKHRLEEVKYYSHLVDMKVRSRVHTGPTKGHTAKQRRWEAGSLLWTSVLTAAETLAASPGLFHGFKAIPILNLHHCM